MGLLGCCGDLLATGGIVGWGMRLWFTMGKWEGVWIGQGY